MADSTSEPGDEPAAAPAAGVEALHPGAGGTELGLRLWPHPDPIAIVQVVHGLAEHCGRYAPLAAALNAAGYAVLAHDVRGHGLTASANGGFGHMADGDGWPLLVADVAAVRAAGAARWPGRPTILFGHSMGSVLALSALEAAPDAYAAAIFSGPPGLPPPAARAGLVLARLEALRLGQRGRSVLLHGLSFGAYARAVPGAATPFDWLSRDPQAVAAYLDDPWCGARVSVGSWTALVRGLVAATAVPAVAGLAEARTGPLPLLIVAGAEDPVGARGKAVQALAARLGAAGMRQVELRLYPGARHELLNEVNRSEVLSDLLAWLGRLDRGA